MASASPIRQWARARPWWCLGDAVNHLGLEWEEPRVRDFWETIGRHHLVVRYDKHGCGLSDRNRTDFSLDSEVRTIEAIVEKVGLNSFALWVHGGQGAAAAIAYAVKVPDRVSYLILYGTQARWHSVPAWGGVDQETFRPSGVAGMMLGVFAVATLVASALMTRLGPYRSTQLVAQPA
jgi:pimeloyl-ACP methyl ester carboxylesterase